MILLNPDAFPLLILNAPVSLHDRPGERLFGCAAVQSILHQLVHAFLVDSVKDLWMVAEF